MCFPKVTSAHSLSLALYSVAKACTTRTGVGAAYYTRGAERARERDARMRCNMERKDKFKSGKAKARNMY